MTKLFQAQPQDAYGIRRVLYQTWLDTYPNEELGITVDDIEYIHKDLFTQESLDKFAQSLNGSGRNKYFYVAKDGENVVGVCRMLVLEEKNQLQMIYVLPEYQGKGIGKLLWDEVSKHIDKAKDTYVEVATYNSSAIKFYERLGFVDMGKRFSDERFRMKSGNIIPQMEMKLQNK